MLASPFHPRRPPDRAGRKTGRPTGIAEVLGPLAHVPLILGAALITLGYCQFFLFFGLDRLGVIEIGNGVGHGLFLWLSVRLGSIFLLIGLVFASVRVLLRRRR